jgi:hypothetical protein
MMHTNLPVILDRRESVQNLNAEVKVLVRGCGLVKGW